MRVEILSTLAFTATLSSAHFQILYPPQGYEFSEEEQTTGPCGGPIPEVNGETVDVQVDQFAISVRSGHPKGAWSFSYTNSTSEPLNFTEISTLEVQGVGDFCLTSFSVPSELAGSSGIVQVVNNAEDGMLYQCFPANFVEGANSTIGPACTNSSGVTAAPGTSDGLSPANMSGTASMSQGASATAAGASSSASPDAAAMVTGVGALAGLGMVVAGLAL